MASRNCVSNAVYDEIAVLTCCRLPALQGTAKFMIAAACLITKTRIKQAGAIDVLGPSLWQRETAQRISQLGINISLKR